MNTTVSVFGKEMSLLNACVSVLFLCLFLKAAHEQYTLYVDSTRITVSISFGLEGTPIKIKHKVDDTTTVDDVITVVRDRYPHIIHIKGCYVFVDTHDQKGNTQKKRFKEKQLQGSDLLVDYLDETLYIEVIAFPLPVHISYTIPNVDIPDLKVKVSKEMSVSYYHNLFF